MSAKRTEPKEPKQLKFFDALIDNGGDVAQAAEAADYSREYAYTLAKRYKEYLIDRVEGAIYLGSVRAAKVLVETLVEDGTTAAAKIRLDAAKDILDRSGVVKTDKSEVKVDTPNGVFILPAKDIPKDDED